MKQINRRKFIKNFSTLTSGVLFGGSLLSPYNFALAQTSRNYKSSIYIAKNGTPEENVNKVIQMKFGSIEQFIGYDDVVIINPNGQWHSQGATNCETIMGLINLVLNRPGGFDGEIIVTENTQFQTHGYWDVSSAGLIRNGPYNFQDMISYYQNLGHSNVTGVRLWRQIDDPENWPVISSPADGQGWVRPEWVSPTTGCLLYLPYPVIRSPYSNRLIDLKNGVYENGYNQNVSVKFIKMPTLNNHGWSGDQDYAGITSAVKSFLGITELEGDYRGAFADGHRHMHTYDDFCHGNTISLKAFTAGEAVGAWLNYCRMPDAILTTAEWVGWESRIDAGAVNAKTVGLGDDPATLDYYMSKYVLWPTHTEQLYFDPNYDIANNRTRQTINGCMQMGFGTTDEELIAAYIYDYNQPVTFRFEIDRMIKKFRDGEATEQDVLNLIDSFNQ